MTYYYLCDTVTADDGSIRPDIPSGTDFVANYNSDNTKALVRVNASLDENSRRTRKLPDEGVEEAATSLGIPARDPLDRWRAG